MGFAKEDERIGNVGEEFWGKHAMDLVRTLKITKLQRQKVGNAGKVAGADFTGRALSLETRYRDEDSSNEENLPEETESITETLAEWVDDYRKQGGIVPPDAVPHGTEIKVEFLRGPFEIKTERIEQYLTWKGLGRFSGYPDVISFPIWHYEDRAKYGYLYDMFFPNLRDHMTAQPILLAKFFIDKLERPYAAIVFEDFKALKAKLIEIAGALGVDLATWKDIPAQDPYKKWRPKNPDFYLVKNMWKIPFEDLQSLMTVTMIGDSLDLEQISKESGTPISVLQRRYGRLVKLANGRHITSDELDLEHATLSPEHLITYLTNTESSWRRDSKMKDLVRGLDSEVEARIYARRIN